MLRITWEFGRPRIGAEEDDARAHAAAMAVFKEAGVDPAEAYAEFSRQFAEPFFQEFTGIAAVWDRACSAADVAATEGWHDPNGAAVTLEVV